MTIYHGDCREVLPSLGRFDLLLTDPPYGLGEKVWGKAHTKPGNKARWRMHHGEMGWDGSLPDLAPALALADKAIVWGGHLFGLPPKRGWLVWNKIIRNWSSGTSELAWTTLDIPVDTFDYSHGQLASEGKYHPTQKPLPLIQWCITKAGDVRTILDPYAGSGTTARAAKDLGRKCTAIEQNERYCEIAAERCRQETLFGDAA